MWTVVCVGYSIPILKSWGDVSLVDSFISCRVVLEVMENKYSANICPDICSERVLGHFPILFL